MLGEALQLSWSDKFCFCFGEGADGAVKRFVKSFAVKTQASIAGLQRDQLTKRVAQWCSLLRSSQNVG